MNTRDQETRKLVDELHFTYEKSRPMLRQMLRSIPLDPLGLVLAGQHEMGVRINADFVKLALENGTPARPCVCADAARLLDAVHHAERSALKEHRNGAIIQALMHLHSFLLRLWQQLIDRLREGADEFFTGCVHLQQQEAELHRELVDMGKRFAA